VKELVEHGITTTRSDYWMMLHPLDRAVYYFSVVGFRELIARACPPQREARSKSGSITGRGYILSKERVARSLFDSRYVNAINWSDLSDRQKGLRGQPIAIRLLNDCVLLPALRRPFWFIVDKAAQFEVRDTTNGEVSIEIKTDCTETENIYVQTHEKGHDVHALEGGGHRVTKFEDC